MLLAEIRQSWRTLVQTPGFVLALMLTMALGIGSNAAVLGFMNGLLTGKAPLVVDDLRTVSLLSRLSDGGFGFLSYADYLTVRDGTQVFEAVVAARETRHSVTVGERSVVAVVALLTPEARGLFGLPAADGVITSAEFRDRELGGNRNAAAKELVVDGVTHAVAGVAPAGLEGIYAGRPIDLWIVGDASRLRPARDGQTLTVLARLRDGVSTAEAQSALDSLSVPAVPIAVHTYTGLTPEMQSGMSRLGRLMPAVAGAVFLIACANVTVFLLSRAVSRSRETSLRLAVGATRGALARAVLVDSALMATAGGVAGALVGFWTSNIIPALLFEADAERMTFVADRAGVMTAAGVSALIVLCCGMVPLLENRHDTPGAVLRREPRRPSKALGWLRSTLVVFQLAVCCILVISAATVSSALDASLRTGAGERLGKPILATLEWERGFDRPDLALDYFERVEQTALVEPGITSAAWMGTLPGRSGSSWYPVTVEPPGLDSRQLVATVDVFTARSLTHVNLPPKAGRMFGAQETKDTCRVAIMAEPTAESWFGGRAVGRVIEDPGGNPVEVIGVVSPKTQSDSKEARSAIYYYAEQVIPPFGPLRPETFAVPVLPPAVEGMLAVQVVSNNYFASMGLAFPAGGSFEAVAPREACRVGVLNEEAAQLYFGGNAVGGAVIDRNGRRTRIVGVVRDARLRSTQQQAEPSIYVPMEQNVLPRMHVMLGSVDANDDLVAAVRRRLAAVDGSRTPTVAVITLENRLRQTALATERIAGLLLAAASVNALALAILGLYRITADDVLMRQQEIAVRSALGAQPWRLLLMVATRSSRVAFVGAVLGIVGAWLVARWMTVIGFDGSPGGMAWLAGPAVLATGTLLASLVPARRILTVEALTAMRGVR